MGHHKKEYNLNVLMNYTFMVTCMVMKYQQEKLVSVITLVTDTISSHSLITSLST